ncbi:hypothetical protein PMZ80_000926 [Knufia obscura]|uniref:Uncharacterized protein n=2 Tax=Knufia TaxID=430999 RepID=A0AAN8EA27_9EURO|nr:hypothetical protein PMZ80_000926 [Knufia obscura]KAK5950279.1 hypothetical protein OHC33_008748 [Knufia fluminis]
MGLFSRSSSTKKTSEGFVRTSSTGYQADNEYSYSRNPYHRTPRGFIEPEDYNTHTRGRRRESHDHDHARGRRAGAPNVSPTRAAYENARAYRQRSPPARRTSRSRTRYGGGGGVSAADFHEKPYTSSRGFGRQRSASPGASYPRYGGGGGGGGSRRGRKGSDGGLAERMAGFSLGEERRYGRRRPSYSSKVERIYEI